MFAVQGIVQPYPWGPTGDHNAVAFFARKQNLSLVSADHKAELWLGSHPNGSAQAAKLDPGAEAAEFRDLRKILLAQKANLPFLLKVLSIESPLSLQLHPDATSAAKLHALDPDHYRDPCDKPEVCIPISTTFELFCGFLKARDICLIAKVVPFMNQLVERMDPPGGEYPRRMTEPEFYRGLLKALYGLPQDGIDKALGETAGLDLDSPALRSAYKMQKSSLLSSVVTAITGSNSTAASCYELLQDTLSTFKSLHTKYPSDRGCFAAFFLMKHKLTEGQPMLIPPNTIHAYLTGECLEVMKTSDNVVRAGLTNKFQDVETLLACTSYVRFKPPALIHSRILGDKSSNEKFTLDLYRPKCTDAFNLALLRVTAGCGTRIDLSRHMMMNLSGANCRANVQQVLCLSGIAELVTAQGTRHTLEAGGCILVFGECIQKVAAVSEHAVEGYYQNGSATSLLFVWTHSDCEPKRRVSVTAASLTETSSEVCR